MEMCIKPITRVFGLEQSNNFPQEMLKVGFYK